MSKTFRHDPHADTRPRSNRKARTFADRQQHRHTKRLTQEAGEHLLKLLGLNPETLRPASRRLC